MFVSPRDPDNSQVADHAPTSSGFVMPTAKPGDHPYHVKVRCLIGPDCILASDWSNQITWPVYWSLIGLESALLDAAGVRVPANKEWSAPVHDHCHQVTCLIGHHEDLGYQEFKKPFLNQDYFKDSTTNFKKHYLSYAHLKLYLIAVAILRCWSVKFAILTWDYSRNLS